MRYGMGLIGVACVWGLISSGCAGKGERRGADPPAADAPGAVPGEKASGAPSETILLTGFEPFGGASLNPSWEAVRALEGTRIGPFRLRVLVLPVVWGEPLPALRRAVEALRPVAVFSFGQGGEGAISFERVADNERRPVPDNRKSLPPSRTIIDDGPPSYVSRFPFSEVAESYDGPPWPLVESREAGGYLCEECLYSLEILRDEVPWPMDVAFFHVPPLRSEVQAGDERVVCGAEELAKCVRALVSAWVSIRKGGNPARTR